MSKNNITLWQETNVPSRFFTAVLKVAKQGNAEAQHTVCRMLCNGILVQQNLEEAARWCRRSAMKGNIRAQERLAAFYAEGVGIKKDLVLSAKWLCMANEQ